MRPTLVCYSSSIKCASSRDLSISWVRGPAGTSPSALVAQDVGAGHTTKGSLRRSSEGPRWGCSVVALRVRLLPRIGRGLPAPRCGGGWQGCPKMTSLWSWGTAACAVGPLAWQCATILTRTMALAIFRYQGPVQFTENVRATLRSYLILVARFYAPQAQATLSLQIQAAPSVTAALSKA